MSHPPARRVALITHVAALSGAELAMMRLVKHLDRDRFDPVVVTFADGPLVTRLMAEGIETAVVPLAAGVASTRRATVLSQDALRQTGSVAAFVPRLARTLRALKLDVLHTHSLKADLLSVATRPLVSTPLVWHVHDRISSDYLPPRTAQLVRSLARRVPRHIVVNSWATASTLLPLPRGFTVAYPGLEPEEFVRRAPTSAGTASVIGILGRIGPTKGQDHFLRAAAALRQTHPDARFRVIGAPLFGENDYDDSLRVLTTDLGLQDCVEFVGFVQDPATALRELTLCVHASPVPEPFGQVIVEAMAAGVPTVVTDAGGASEIVRDRGNVLARLAAPGSAKDLADGMRWILDHPVESAALCDRASLSVQRRFGIDRTAQAVMDAWDSVLHRRDG